MQDSNVFATVMSFFGGSKNSKNGKNSTTGTASFVIEGTIRSAAPGKLAVCDNDMIVDDETWVIGNIAPGVSAKISGVWQDGVRHARKVLITNQH